jgi:hypothetical protein
MAISQGDLITMLRNVTGRVDASDPLFTDQIMATYLQNNIQLISTQDVRLFKNKTWFEFILSPSSPDPFPIDLQTIDLANGQVGASTIEPPCYANGFFVYWYQSPQEFFQIWPETQTYVPSRPTYVLYYNNELIFRNPPDTEYLIKMEAYQVEWQVDVVSEALKQDYVYRYIVYSTALDIFGDYGEIDQYQKYFPLYQRYKNLVVQRTWCQQQNQRPAPEF